MIPGHMVVLLAIHGHFFLLLLFFELRSHGVKYAFWGRMGFLVAEPRVTTGGGNRCTARLEVLVSTPL